MLDVIGGLVIPAIATVKVTAGLEQDPITAATLI